MFSSITGPLTTSAGKQQPTDGGVPCLGEGLRCAEGGGENTVYGPQNQERRAEACWLLDLSD